MTGPWPTPAAGAVFHGLAGEFVALTEPHSEAHPMALLAQFLVAFGAACGRGAHYPVEASRHHPNEFCVLVGPSAKGRKGSSWDHVEACLAATDAAFVDDGLVAGLSSGEGLIAHVCDATDEHDNDAPDDKRRLVLEQEFAQVLKVLAREGNTLSPVVRQAWDGKPLQTMVRHSPLRAREAHIAIIGHITRDELLRYLNATELANGFFNRFLLVAVDRSKLLPFGGTLQPAALTDVSKRLGTSVRFAQTAGPLTFDDHARERWIAAYPVLSRGEAGLLGAATARAEAHTVRLALLYALLDSSPVIRARTPRGCARGLGLQLLQRRLDLRRQPRRPDRRRHLGAREEPRRRRHADRGPRPLLPQQEGARDRPRAHDARRGRPPPTTSIKRRTRAPDRDLGAPARCLTRSETMASGAGREPPPGGANWQATNRTLHRHRHELYLGSDAFKADGVPVVRENTHASARRLLLVRDLRDAV